MKQEIRYRADPEVTKLIHRWESWLLNERRYSKHTLDAYARDLAEFMAFVCQHKGVEPTLQTLQKFDVRDFRAYLSFRAGRHIEKSSLARELSSLKNFFKWLDINNLAKNSALSVIAAPRKPKVLPKALDVDDTFNVIDEARSIAKTTWQGLRDAAIFTLLYG